MLKFNIEQPSREIAESLQKKIDGKTKPLGALGKLETLALRLGRIQNTVSPVLRDPTIVVFAGDHGVAAEGVSPYPQEVTYQMVMNILSGGAAINVFGRQNGIEIQVVDAGVNHDFEPTPDLISAKIAKGTASFLKGAAMTEEQCLKAVKKGGDVVAEIHKGGCNVIGFGEMGIGNTSSAALIMSLICKIPIENCVGRGAGVDDSGLARKKQILKKALDSNPCGAEPLSILSMFGGFEIAMICGAFLKAAELKMVVLVDGFIATSALLVADQIDPLVKEYCVFSHQSDESGHRAMLESLGGDPLLKLDMRLGEGSGAATAYPLLKSAADFLANMASFESAGVSEKDA